MHHDYRALLHILKQDATSITVESIEETYLQDVALALDVVDGTSFEIAIPRRLLADTIEPSFDMLIRIDQDVYPTINTGDLGANFITI